MIYTQDRSRLRNYYRQVYQKALAGETLQPLEELIADVIREHSEYHSLFASGTELLDDDFAPEDGQINPWLHLGMHIALREQVGTDRPAGIADITRSLLLAHRDGHQVEHMMFECLGEALWTAQRDNTPPDDSAYLECLKKLAQSRDG